MNPRLYNNPKQACEFILEESKQWNTVNNAAASETIVIDRMLARGPELADAYEELHNKLNSHQGALQVFLGLVQSTAAYWSPEKIAEARAARSKLAQVNREIAIRSMELANLLSQREELHNNTGFSSNTYYHVVDVIKSAATRNYLFTSYVQEKLNALRSQFDLKYWPALSDCLRALASDANVADPEASDPLTAASTDAARASLSDFFKALFVAMEENSARHYGQLPLNFKVTDNALASLVNCALNLSPDNLVDGPYVKRLRQRLRDEARSEGSLE